jgi:CHASE2 domain-containing sensor protein
LSVNQGLDIYRNLPVEPGNAELATRFELDDNIIAVCKVGDADSVGISPAAYNTHSSQVKVVKHLSRVRLG